jgi:hypothetical protein
MGYLLIERRMLQPHKTDGIAPYPEQMGIIDYLRELKQDALPFAAGAHLLVRGVEDALLDAGSNRTRVTDDMHRIMADRANELEQRRCSVQVVFDWELRFGQELFFIRGGTTERVSLRPLFGNVRRIEEGGNVFYFAGFNLT